MVEETHQNWSIDNVTGSTVTSVSQSTKEVPMDVNRSHAALVASLPIAQRRIGTAEDGSAIYVEVHSMFGGTA